MTHYASRGGDDNVIGPWPLGGGGEGVPQASVELDVTDSGIPHASRCLPEGHDSPEYPVL